MAALPKALTDLIEALGQLPGVGGGESAQRRSEKQIGGEAGQRQAADPQAEQFRHRQSSNRTGPTPVIQQRGAEQILADTLAGQALHLGVIGTMPN